MVDFGRIQKELREIEKDKASGVTISYHESNLQKLTGFVPGPKDTPYEGRRTAFPPAEHGSARKYSALASMRGE